jgi:hypothetical protein
MKRLFLCILCIFYSCSSWAQNVTWADDVACIIYSHCANCHNPTSGLAAFPLMNYNDAYSMRTAVKIYTQNKYMPPYLPNTDNQSYIHEKNLTKKEIDLIKTWADQGAKEGNPANAPSPPKIVTNSKITSADFSERIPTYTLSVTRIPQYRCFVLKNSYKTEKYITELEVLPGNHSAVHHVLVYSDTTSLPILLDAADSAPGYEFFGGVGSHSAKLLYGWMEGSEAYKLPFGMGIKLEANAHIILQIIYAENAGNQSDSTRLKMKFDNTGNIRKVSVESLLSNMVNLQNPPFIIPANTTGKFYERYKVDSDITILSIAPQAHYICSELHSYAVTPQNDTIELVRIEAWNVLWTHGVYPFYHPVKVPSNSTIFAEGVYNNTADNGNNPFDPPRDISPGDADTTETMLFYFSYLPYQIDDERIIVDTVVHEVHYLNCSPMHTVGINNSEQFYNFSIYPNPASNILNINFNLKVSSLISIDITDINGHQVAPILKEKLTTGQVLSQFNTSFLPNGNYLIRIRTNGIVSNYKLEIIR